MFQIKHNDNLSVPIGNLVWAQAFFERFGLDEVTRALKTKGTDLVKPTEAKGLQRNLEQGKKLKKRYQIDNVLIKAAISLQTKLT